MCFSTGCYLVHCGRRERLSIPFVSRCFLLSLSFLDRNEQDNNEATNNDNFGFKSRKCSPQNSELGKFEADLLDQVHNIKFRDINNKDQKDNFANHFTWHLLNPAKSELSKVSKQILYNINSKIRKTKKLNQWKNTSDVTNWFTSIADMLCIQCYL